MKSIQEEMISDGKSRIFDYSLMRNQIVYSTLGLSNMRTIFNFLAYFFLIELDKSGCFKTNRMREGIDD